MLQVLTAAAVAVATVAALVAARFRRIARIPLPRTGTSLSLLERWYFAQPQRRRVAGAITDWTLCVEDTQRVVDLVLARYKLNCDVAMDAALGGELTWVERSSHNDIVVEQQQQQEDDAAWEAVMGRMLSENPALREPMIRVALTSGGILIVMMDHLLTDGQGFAGFIEALLDCANHDVEPPPPTAPSSSSPSVEQAYNIELDFAGLVRRVLFGPKPGFVGPLPRQDSLPATAAVTLVKSFTLSDAQVSSLLHQSRQRGTTLTAVMAAASARSLNLLLEREEYMCRIEIPVSLRSQCGTSTQVGGNYVAPFSMTLPVTSATDGETWTHAVLVRQELARALPEVHKNLGLLAFAGGGDFTRYQSNKQEKLSPVRGRASTIEVSNLGQRQTTTRQWFFAQGNHYMGPIFAVNVVTTAANTLSCTVTASSAVVSSNQLELFTHGLKRELVRMKRG